ncbi:MAG: hypothetical protein ABS87_04590 [Sphingomonas sp. SCN 67-18]|uniref:metallophosphoesterase n=1 Tax=uncultured Sphingomonas sp. TaxID=158754 RepID=UPI00086F2CD9|nr:metallophosphoesterase [Sphingomonas sp. SCN 67-18]ODU21984.1 MAG: hypothetical protein ABS87_04590 [Sphingomonas sp. SCN 67-18]
MTRRGLGTGFALLAMLVLAVCVVGWCEAQRDPLVRHATIALPDWPEGAAPITILLLSDTHVSRLSMPPERLRRIVAGLNRTRPDLILIAGDMVSESLIFPTVPSREAVAPLGGLRAPLGVYAVLGNHDHARGVAEMRRAIVRAGITLLKDKAVRAGPLALGGIDDSVTDHSDFESTVHQMRALPGAKVILSHGISYRNFLPPDIHLMLAGHTHCGQINPPFFSGRRPCGMIRWPGHSLIVGAGLGTSIVPLRWNAPPDVWLIRVGPPQRR